MIHMVDGKELAIPHVAKTAVSLTPEQNGLRWRARQWHLKKIASKEVHEEKSSSYVWPV